MTKHDLMARKVYIGAKKDPKLVRVVTMLHPDVVRQIDDWGLLRGKTTRTASIRSLLEAGLETEKAPEPRLGNRSDASQN